ncbi:hypothetical protein [Pseudoalteromonas sp. T1lg23B]|nr:hypothetical protein [Pseudoalteromonas sp. T1lg23B]
MNDKDGIDKLIAKKSTEYVDYETVNFAEKMPKTTLNGGFRRINTLFIGF